MSKRPRALHTHTVPRMIHRQALSREMGLTTGAALLVVAAIELVVLFVRLLGRAARGELANEAVFAFLGFSLLGSLPVLMSIALFSGVLMTFARMWRESEMVVWFNSGISLVQWLRPVMAFAVPFALVLLLLTLVVNPWVQEKKNDYRDALKSRGDSGLVVPGMFAESSGGARVYYVESLNPLTGVVRNVFMQSWIDGQLGLVVAREGRYTQLEDGSRYLVFEGGRRYEGTPGQLDYRIVEFKRYWMRLDPVAVDPRGITHRALPLGELVQDDSPSGRAELLWRVSLPLASLVIAALAIPLGYVNARARRSYGFLVALLLYVIYYNFISVSQAWVAQARLDFWVGLLLPHVLMLIVTVAWFAGRSGVRSRLWRTA